MQLQVSLLGESNQRVKRITDDILEIAKLESGQFSLKLEPFSVNTLVLRSIRQHQQGATLGSVQVDVDFGELPNVLLGDPNRIDQVLLNLISNGG